MRLEKGQHRETEPKEKDAPPRVFLKRAPDGTWRKQWVGRWGRDGKKHDATLCRWEGTPPDTATGTGDPAFERSRERAIALLREAMRKDYEAGEEAVIVQRVHSIRYGRKVGRVKIAELAERWDALPHKADMTEERRARVHYVLKCFRDFMEKRFPNVTEAGALTAEHFKGFLDGVDASGVSARSWNDYLSILRGVLAKVDGQSKGFREYLAPLPKKAETTIHRRPFSGGELDAIIRAAREVDRELYPVIVTAACTALRRGDVARLRWESLDMTEGFVTVKTTKTGETVEIPIFPPFMVALKEAERTRREGVPYVFPKIALAYQRNPDSLNVRLRKVLAAAGFLTPEKMGGKYPAPDSPAAAVRKVDEGMRREGWRKASREKGLAILQRHLKGEKGKEIAAALEMGAATVSEYLHAMEDAGAVALVTHPKAEDATRPTLAKVKDGEQRKQRGSLCGWHSFRTTFCTLALQNGVPMDILRKITGHRTAEIVLKHYDRRGREAMRKVLGTAMPKAIAGAVEDRGTPAELEAVPAELARAARKLEESGLGAMLADASPEVLEKVAGMLAAEGGKAKTARRKGGRK